MARRLVFLTSWPLGAAVVALTWLCDVQAPLENVMVARTLACLTFLFCSIVLVGACDGGAFTNAEAVDRCNQEKIADPGCSTTESEAACVMCFEDCGDACGAVNTACPHEYLCDE